VGGGFAGTVISRRGAEALSFLAMALALRHLGGMTSVSSVTDTIFASGLLGGTTSVSSGTDAGEADLTNRRQRILDFLVMSKLLAVDTEVDPPQQNRRHIRHRVVFSQ